MVSNGEEDFIFGIFLPAKTCKILVSAEVDPSNGFEHANPRRKVREFPGALAPKKTPRQHGRRGVIPERCGSEQEHCGPPPRLQMDQRKHTRSCSLFALVWQITALNADVSRLPPAARAPQAPPAQASPFSPGTQDRAS